MRALEVLAAERTESICVSRGKIQEKGTHYAVVFLPVGPSVGAADARAASGIDVLPGAGVTDSCRGDELRCVESRVAGAA